MAEGTQPVSAAASECQLSEKLCPGALPQTENVRPAQSRTPGRLKACDNPSLGQRPRTPTVADPNPEANEPPPDPADEFTAEDEALLAEMGNFTPPLGVEPCLNCSLVIVVALIIYRLVFG